MLPDGDQVTLQEIIDTGGDCMQSDRCQRCPFRSMCLPSFLNPIPPSKNARFNMAMDVIVHNALVEETDTKTFKEEFRNLTSNHSTDKI